MTPQHPQHLDDVLSLIKDAMADGAALAIVGHGSKSDWGYPVAEARPVVLDRLSGVIDYQPEELILTVRAGTAMTEINKALAKQNQMLGFEPPDLGELYGANNPSSNKGSIGGVLATNLSGSRRLTAGAARDFLLGFEAASGRGERFRSGGKVVKNVTGYDLSKLICGSFGTLAIMDEITLKTLPKPEATKSLIFPADDLAAAGKHIAAILATPHEPSAAAILPADMAAKAGYDMDKMLVVIRLEGFAVSVNARADALLALYAGGDEIDDKASQSLWQLITNTVLLADSQGDIWKVSCPATAAPAIIQGLKDVLPKDLPLRYYADWAGGLLWLDLPSQATPEDVAYGARLRQILADHGGGFAQLIRDSNITRQYVPAFQPLADAQFGLHKRIKAAFDPMRVLNPGRMHHDI